MTARNGSTTLMYVGVPPEHAVARRRVAPVQVAPHLGGRVVLVENVVPAVVVAAAVRIVHPVCPVAQVSAKISVLGFALRGP